MARLKLSPRSFCLAWQESDTLEEFCSKVGYLNPRVATLRAVKYRNRGIPLKRFGEINYVALSEEVLAALEKPRKPTLKGAPRPFGSKPKMGASDGGSIPNV